MGAELWKLRTFASWYFEAGQSLMAAREIATAVPTMYLYRHALELALKDANAWTEVVISLRADLGTIDPAEVQSNDRVAASLHGHRIGPLVDRLKRRFRLIEPDDRFISVDDLDKRLDPGAEAVIRADRDGLTLRYPVAREVLAAGELSGLFFRVASSIQFLLGDLAPWLEDTVESGIEDVSVQALYEQWRQRRAVDAVWRQSATPLGIAHDVELDAFKADAWLAI